MNKIILKLLITIICAIVIILFGVCAVFGTLWIIDFFNIPAYIFVPFIAILFLWCIYKEFFGGDKKMTQMKYCISFTKEFYKKLKKCAEARNVTVASYIKEAIAQRMDNERG